MKAIFTVTLTVFLVSSSALSSSATYRKPVVNNAVSTSTANNVFGRINAHRKQTGISLTWSAYSAAGISSFVIERSWDGIYFESIDEVEAIDGVNRYQDNDIYPGHLYYRIVAVMNDGTQIASDIEMVKIVKNG